MSTTTASTAVTSTGHPFRVGDRVDATAPLDLLPAGSVLRFDDGSLFTFNGATFDHACPSEHAVAATELFDKSRQSALIIPNQVPQPPVTTSNSPLPYRLVRLTGDEVYDLLDDGATVHVLSRSAMLHRVGTTLLTGSRVEASSVAFLDGDDFPSFFIDGGDRQVTLSRFGTYVCLVESDGK